MFISEKIIDKVSEKFEENPEKFETVITELEQTQPALLAYLFSENFDLLIQEERDYLIYITIIIYKSVEKTQGLLPKITEKAIEIAEEKNWEIISNITAKRFRDRIDVFFQDYPQEDLLAFIEDALIDDEDSFITKEGREPMFIALKTIVDLLTNIG